MKTDVKTRSTKTALIVVSVVSLAIVCVAPALYAMGVASAAFSQGGMLVGTVGWFAATPFWMRSRKG